MRTCLFCDEAANDREHLWPLWILRGLEKTKDPIRQNRGNDPAISLNTPEIKIRCVCKNCNNGWMSDLENENKPIIGSLMRDISTPLDSEQQHLISLWALKTAMVLERAKPPGYRHCYGIDQCHQLRLSLAIPARTSVWLGRLSQSVLHANGVDFNLREDQIPGYGILTNIIVGHLVIQLVTVHVPEKYEGQSVSVLPHGGQWDRYTVSIWPHQRRVNWPPELTLNVRGDSSIVGFLHRYKPRDVASESADMKQRIIGFTR